MSDLPPKVYAGDGVYVEIDDQGVILTTEDGISVTNRIVLEVEVWRRVKEFVLEVAGE